MTINDVMGNCRVIQTALHSWQQYDACVEQCDAKISVVWHAINSRECDVHARAVMHRMETPESQRVWIAASNRSRPAQLRATMPCANSGHENCSPMPCGARWTLFPRKLEQTLDERYQIIFSSPKSRATEIRCRSLYDWQLLRRVNVVRDGNSEI